MSKIKDMNIKVFKIITNENEAKTMAKLSKIKDMNIKVFKTITNKNEAKTMAKLVSYDCKCKFNSAICKSTKNGIMINANASVK